VLYHSWCGEEGRPVALRSRDISDICQLTFSKASDQDPAPSQDIVTAAKGSGIIFIGQLFEYASRFLFGIILARSIGAEGYGLYNLGDTLAATISIFALLGLPSGVIRFLPGALREGDEERVWGILQVAIALVGAFSLLLAVGAFGLSDWIAWRLFHEPAAVPVLRLATVWVPLTAMGLLLAAATRGFNRMRYQVYANGIAFNVIRVALTVLVLSIGLGVPGVFVANAVASAITVGLLVYFLNQLFPLRRPFRAARRDTRQLLSFSLPLFLAQVIYQLRSQIELLVLGVLGTVASVGVYGAALRIQMVGTALLFAVQTAAMPIIADLCHRGKHAQLCRLYRTLTKWAFSFNLPFFLTTILFAEPILAIFGREFTIGTSVLIIAALGTLINAATGICSAIINMTGQSRLSFYNALVSLVLRLTLDVLLIRAWGMVGAAVATGLVIVVIGVVLLIEVRLFLGVWPYDLTFFKPVVAGFVAFVVGLVMARLVPADLNLFYLVLDVGLLWLSYAAVTLLLRLSEEDQIVVNRIKRQFGAKLRQIRTPSELPS
jgi:O-antigen/teichoic acid export membrane protein